MKRGIKIPDWFLYSEIPVAGAVVLLSLLTCKVMQNVVPASFFMLLGIGTWIIYTADRLLDLHFLNAQHWGGVHGFVNLHKRAFQLLLAGAIVICLALALYEWQNPGNLNLLRFFNGLFWLTALYFAGNYLWVLKFKQIFIAFICWYAISMFHFPHPAFASLFQAVYMLALWLLIFQNIVLISWLQARANNWPTSIYHIINAHQKWGKTTEILLFFLQIISVVALVFAAQSFWEQLIALSFGLVFFLYHQIWKAKTNTFLATHSRFCADFALWLPAFVLLIPH